MKATQSLRSAVFTRAWKIYRNDKQCLFGTGTMTFGKALSIAWSLSTKVNPKDYLKTIFQKLNFVQVKNTQDWWKLSTQRGIKNSQDPEVKEMIDSGLVPLADIIVQRRRATNKYTFAEKKPEPRRKRNRIYHNCEKIQIEDYV